MKNQVDQTAHHDLPSDAPAGDLTRRRFIGGAAIGVAAAAAGGNFIMSHDAGAHGRDRDDWRDDRWNDRNDRRDCPRGGGRKDRVLLKGGIVMSMDLAVGNYTKADVLIEGKKIIAVAAEHPGFHVADRRLHWPDRNAGPHQHAPPPVLHAPARHHRRRKHPSGRRLATGGLQTPSPARYGRRAASPTMER